MLQASDAFKADRDSVRASMEELGKAPQEWAGAASAYQSDYRQTLIDDSERLADDLDRVSSAYLQTADTVAKVTRHVNTATSLASAHRFQIDDNGVVSDVSAEQFFETTELMQQHVAERIRLRNEILTEVEDAFRAAHEADTAIAQAAAAATRGTSADERGSDRLNGHNYEWDQGRSRGPGGWLWSNDWAGRAILQRYLAGDFDPWQIEDDPRWSQYMMDNMALTGRMWARNQDLAIEAWQLSQNGGPGIHRFDDSFSARMENGEAIVGWQYLHGTDEGVGGFKHHGLTEVIPRSDGTFEVRINSRYEWNDVIDPNAAYDTDRLKDDIAVLLSLGERRAYNIHIRWFGTQTVFVDANGEVIHVVGWPR